MLHSLEEQLCEADAQGQFNGIDEMTRKQNPRGGSAGWGTES
jgi:hypothetical protein